MLTPPVTSPIVGDAVEPPRCVRSQLRDRMRPESNRNRVSHER